MRGARLVLAMGALAGRSTTAHGEGAMEEMEIPPATPKLGIDFPTEEVWVETVA